MLIQNNQRKEMIVEQHAGYPELDRLKQDWVAIPPLVLVPRHVDAANEVIKAVAEVLKISISEDASAPPRPALAGRLWDEVSEPIRQLYAAVTRELESSGGSKSWPEEQVEAAADTVRKGMMRLSQLPQQPMSGMVQRHS